MFYYRVQRNDKIVGRTTSTSFEVTAPAIEDDFTVEGVDFSQNTGVASVRITYNNKSGYSAATMFASSDES